MLTLPPSVRIYLAVEPVDLRRGHDGLGAIVRGQWGENLFAGHLFVFLGRRRDRCKILFWDRGGLVLYYKRLEKGALSACRAWTSDGRSVEMDMTEAHDAARRHRRPLRAARRALEARAK